MQAAAQSVVNSDSGGGAGLPIPGAAPTPAPASPTSLQPPAWPSPVRRETAPHGEPLAQRRLITGRFCDCMFARGMGSSVARFLGFPEFAADVIPKSTLRRGCHQRLSNQFTSSQEQRHRLESRTGPWQGGQQMPPASPPLQWQSESGWQQPAGQRSSAAAPAITLRFSMIRSKDQEGSA